MSAALAFHSRRTFFLLVGFYSSFSSFSVSCEISNQARLLFSVCVCVCVCSRKINIYIYKKPGVKYSRRMKSRARK